MSKTVRNILMIIILIFTFAILAVFLGAALIARDDILYRSSYDAELYIKDVTAENLGKTWQGIPCSEGKTFYRLEILHENVSNVSEEKSTMDYAFETANGYISVWESDGLLPFADRYLIPAGYEAWVPVILEVPEEATELEIHDWADEDVSFKLALR